MVDIARPESVVRKKKIRRALYGTAGLVVIILITVGVSQLKPAAPTVERTTVWIDTVKRGDMSRQVRGSGTLVPEDIQWIPATTQGRVERILLRPGATVTPDSVILILTNPDLEQSVKDAELLYASAQANYQNRKTELESALLNQQADVAGIEASYKDAVMTLEANRELAKDKLVGTIQLRQSESRAEELKNRLTLAKQRLVMSTEGVKSQMAPQESEVEQRRAALQLRVQQLGDLKVKAGMSGVLQLVPVEVGAQVGPGTNLARVAGRLVLEWRAPDWRLFSGRERVSKTVFITVGEVAERTSAESAAFFMW